MEDVAFFNLEFVFGLKCDPRSIGLWLCISHGECQDFLITKTLWAHFRMLLLSLPVRQVCTNCIESGVNWTCLLPRKKRKHCIA